MKRFTTLLLLAVAMLGGALNAAAQESGAQTAKQPKYVIYFIGDGMGVNHVNGTETYLAALEGRIGITPLAFCSFPNIALVTTYSASNGITDSAASGTAFACGVKTYNSGLGVYPDSVTPATSIAVWAHEAGAAVGISTSVSVDHATPAAFYAHQARRNNYYEIGQDLVRSGFEFFAGSDFLRPTRKAAEGAEPEPDIYTQAAKEGYSVCRGFDATEAAISAGKERIIMLQSEAASAIDRTAIPYAIDRKEGDMTLQQITRAGLDFLYKTSPDRFFFFIEGGKIDWAAHANDAATVYREIIDLDEAVKVALDFYNEHADETLIIVTADHETGGLGLGNSDYTLHTELLQNQTMSAPEYSRHLNELRTADPEGFTFEKVAEDLKANFGFWDTVYLSEHQENELHSAFDRLSNGDDENQESMYALENELGDLAKKIISQNAHLGWTSGQHTNGYVGAFAVGVGAEAFHGRIDNTDVPQMIGKIAGYIE